MAFTRCDDDETDEWDSAHVNLMSAAAAPASSWADEVDEVDEVDAVARKRVVARKRAKIECLLRAGETDEQRRLREREAQEEDDAELVGDMFGANVYGSSSANLRSKDDHQQIAKKIGTKLVSSKRQHVVEKKKKRAVEANKRAEMKKEQKAKKNADLIHQEDLFGGTKHLHDEFEHWNDLEDNFL